MTYPPSPSLKGRGEEGLGKEREMLKYIGNGAFIPGVPARDLTADEVKQYGGEKVLLASGIYEKIKKED